MTYVCRILSVTCVIFTLCLTHHTYGQCELDILFAADAGHGSRFGKSVAIDGELMIIGAHYDSGSGVKSGAAYVFRRVDSIWIEEAKLFASDGEMYDHFGRSVDICGDQVIVGAPRYDGADGESGAAYIFKYEPETAEWVEQAILLASHASYDDQTGFSVAISGDVAVISSHRHDHSAGFIHLGSAYVFRSSDGGQVWEEEMELLAHDGATYDYFGISVDIEGDTILIGAYLNDDNGNNSGSAYIFQYDPKVPDKWTQTQKLLPLRGNAGDFFGISVAINQKVCAIGATGKWYHYTTTGAAYIFRQNVDSDLWIEEARLLPSVGEIGDGFGIVAIEDNIVVVGSPEHSNPIYHAGAVYTYQYQEDTEVWVEQGILIASDNGDNYDFGSAVAVAGILGIAGSPDHDGAGSSAGAVYTFNTLASEDSNNNGIPDACETGIGDLNFDNVVNTADVQILFGFWGICPGGPVECLGDINGDQIVNTRDLLILFGNWG